MDAELPDAFLDALADAVADVRREGQREIERISAESRATIAELKAKVGELRGAVKAAADEQIGRVSSALATIKNGDPGRDGRDADPVDMVHIDQIIHEKVAVAFAAVPTPKDGRDGIDGKNADPIADADIAAAVAQYLDANPPKPGDPGAPGEAGKDADAVSAEQIAAAVDAVLPDLIRNAVAHHLNANPPAAGRDGIDGKDGIGLAGALIDRSGSLVLTLGDGTVRDLGCVVGKDADVATVANLISEGIAVLPPARDGRDGSDGKDGLGFDDLEFEHDGERGFALKFVKGERTKRFEFSVPVVLDRGVYRDGQQYEKADAVTFGGSLFIAQCDTSEKPETGKDWRLAVKHGRNGKDGVVRQILPPTPVKIG